MIKISKLIEHLQEYKEMYGDQPLTLYNKDSNEELEIVAFDAFANKLIIEVNPLQDDEDC